MRILLVLSLLAFSSLASAEGFRGMPWGTAEEEILEREGEPLTTKGDCLVYSGSIVERRAVILFCLDGEGLYRGAYVFQQRYPQPYQQHVRDFQRLDRLLKEKYGAPIQESVQWHDPRLWLEPAHWGHRIAIGALELRNEWTEPQAHIVMSLRRGDEGGIAHYVSYESAEQRERERGLL